MRAPKWTEDALELAHVLLCTVRLDGGMQKRFECMPPSKTALESEQTRELQDVPNRELRWGGGTAFIPTPPDGPWPGLSHALRH